jgi:adenosylcobinamide-phosphate synthase
VRRQKVIAAAYLFDWLAGDPEWFPHPVRLMGAFIDQGERALRSPEQSPAAEFVAGGVLAVGLVTATYVVTAKTIAWMHSRGPVAGFLGEVLLAWTCLASRSLHDEASLVITSLESGDTITARQRLARIVGRDTEHLDEHEISRAVVETVAESCSDGVAAPLFYLAIGGVPLAMAYKAVNTLDSMIGHADERYFYFGKIAARLDDVANFLPSRLTALGIALSASAINNSSLQTAFSTWFNDGGKHKSPNAGQPESAMAGALQVRLGGDNFYHGELIPTAVLGKRFLLPSAKDARRAIQIAAAVSVLGVLAALLSTRGRK